jgi:hypothetical protein
MIEIVDSYYLTRSDGNEKHMKCSLIAAYAAELGHPADGYDFRRNMEVREHIERLKACAEACNEVYGEKYQPSVYKSLDVEGFLLNNSGDARLAAALREMDAYWRRVYEYSEQAAKQNRVLMQEKAAREITLREMECELDRLNEKNADLSEKNGKLFVENRYLRKMLRAYLYPAVADEILKNENEPPQTDTKATASAVHDFIENEQPKSFEASVSPDDQMQSEAERLMAKLWGMCDE